MTITVDTSTEDVRTLTTSPQTFSHGGAASGVKGVVLAIVHGTSSTDHVSAASYGGVAMSRKQRNTDTATEPGAAEIWFLGAGVPQGTQTVSYTPGSTTDDIHAVCITLLAAGDTEVIDTDGVSENTANPSVTLQYSGRSAMAFGALYGGGADPTAFTENANCTSVQDHDLGAFYSEVIRQTTAGTSDFAIGGTSGTDDVAFAAIAVAEARVITPDQGALTVSGLAPIVVNSALNVTRTPDPAALTTTGTVSAFNFGIVIPVGAVEILSGGPSVFEEDAHDTGGGGPGLLLPLALNIEPQPPQSISPDPAVLTIAGQVPNFIAGAFMQPDQAPLTVAGQTATFDLGIPQPQAALAVSGLVPTFNVGITHAPDVGTLTASGLAPSLNLTLPLPAGSLTAAGLAPTASATGGAASAWLGPGLLVPLGLNLQQPNFTFSPAAADLQFTTWVPSIGANQQFAVAQGSVAITGQAPNVTLSSGGQAPVMDSPAALVITGLAPTLIVGELVIFSFSSTTAGFVASPGVGTTMQWISSDGNPPGCLRTRTTGKNRNASNVWTLTSDWASLGIPADRVITAVSLGSAESRISEFVNGLLGSVSAVTLTPTAFPPIEVAAARSYGALAEPSFITTTGAGASGLTIPSGGSLTITAGSNLRTSGTGTPAVTLLQDNIRLTVSYTAAKSISPPVGALAVTGHAPSITALAAVAKSPANASLSIQGAGPTVLVTSTATGGGGGPGLTLALALNLEPQALGPAQLVITGYAPSVFRPIFLAGSDELISESATLTASSVNVISQGSHLRAPATQALVITGLAPTLVQTGSRLIVMPVTALTITQYVPTVGQTHVIETGVGSITVSGLGPSLEPNYTVSPITRALSIVGAAPASLVSVTIQVGAGSLVFSGQQPNLQRFVVVGPFAGVVTTQGHAPFITATDSQRVEPAVGAATFTTYAPTVGTDHVRQPGVRDLVISSTGPTVDVPPDLHVVNGPPTASIGLQGYEPLALVSVQVFADVGALSIQGFAPSFMQSVPIAVDVGSATFEGYAPSILFATWNASGAIQSQRASLASSATVIHRGSGTLQAQPPLDFVGAGTHVAVVTGAMQSGPASLGGGILPVTAALQSGNARMLARVRIIRFKPHKRPKPHKVNRFNVVVKKHQPKRFRKPKNRRPFK